MTAISEVLRCKDSKCALIPFITAGYPNLNSTVNALYVLDNEGADVIELGIPYSDALADGPIIQESSRIALEQGVCLDQILNMLKLVSPNLNAPVIIFTYYNPVLVRGIKQFIKDIYVSGARGLIIPDLPLEEIDYLIELCNLFKIELILFIAPTSSDIRICSILSKSPGCIYLVSSYGVTGLRHHISTRIDKLAERIKFKADKLIMLGFGISSSEQVSEIANWNIDGIVIGSAFISVMLNKSQDAAIESLGNSCKKFRMAIDT
uniref:Tryptophan synthase alpha chain n=1 Tax=Mastocarpus papillatus TaxID=31436 RepID=A0A342RZS1_9FLOR|nr:tryptophane synthase alpha subunit [Mastocarpus papillatus]AOL58217.1 tryptophane synthase alpha subunit [Mastocarpus papillatus]